jgi:hypothetical protein
LQKRILLILLLIAATVAGNRLFAQTYPVQAGLMLQPPYSVYLNDYTAVGSNRLALNLLLQDMSRADLPVRLRFHIEGQGFSLRTKDHYLPAPITLESGLPLRLSGDELAGYLSPRNLQVVGGNEGAFLRTGKLPEGVYRFCVEVLEYNRNGVISNPACATGWLLLNDPPLLNLPAHAEKLRAQEPQNIRFNWTPLHTGSPNSAFSTEYEFTLVEVWPQTANFNQAILSTAPIYQTTTNMTSLHYGMAEPPLEPGRTYAWRVRAISMVGVEEIDLFKNGGYSAVSSFQWGDACTAPEGLEAKPYGTTRLKLSWNASPAQSEFIVRYRLQGSEEGWEEENTYLTEHTIGSLQPETSYEVQVVGLCASVTGGTSLTVIGETAVDQNSGFSCGADPGEFNLDNTEPLPELKQGDFIQAGDLEVRIDSVAGSNGTFSGKGVTGLPFLNLIQVRVRFNDIRVNTDYRMFEGNIVTIWDPNSRSVVDVGGDDVMEETGDSGSSGEGSGSDDFEGKDITYEGVMDSVYVNEEGKTIVVDESGEETEYEREPDTDTRITDSEGNVYVVDSEGNVQKGDSASEGNNGGTTPESEGTTADSLRYMIVFDAAGNQRFGFDAYPEEHAALAGNYEQTEIQGETYQIPWKSVRSGEVDPVRLVLTSDTLDVNNLRFAYESGQAISLTGNEETGYILNLSASGHEQLMPVLAYHTAEEEEEGELVGKLNLISYNGLTKKVVLVPVNGAKGFLPNAAALSQQINRIFGPAAANWEVSIHEGYEATEWDRNESGSLDDGFTGLLSNYTREMRRLVKAFMAENEEDEEAFYLFLLDQSESGSKLGYMPRKQRYGFIFTGHSQHQSETALVKTIGHELGHGAFRLEHTYTTYPSLAKGSTGNLMDKRQEGKELRKYQWDLVHNPVTVWGILEDDDDGDLESSDYGLIAELNNQTQVINLLTKGPLRGAGSVNYQNHYVIDANEGCEINLNNQLCFEVDNRFGYTNFQVVLALPKQMEDYTIHTGCSLEKVEVGDLSAEQLEEFQELSDEYHLVLGHFRLNGNYGLLEIKNSENESITKASFISVTKRKPVSIVGTPDANRFYPGEEGAKDLNVNYAIPFKWTFLGQEADELKFKVIDNSETTIYETSLTVTDENLTGSLGWNGISNVEGLNGAVITEEQCPFKVEVEYGIGKALADSLTLDQELKGWNNFKFKTNDLDDFQAIKDDKKEFEDKLPVGKGENLFEYLNQNLIKVRFLGDVIIVHRNFYYLLLLAKNSLPEEDYRVYSDILNITSHYRYRESAPGLSNHRIGMAIDMNVNENPMLRIGIAKEQLILDYIEFITGFTIGGGKGLEESREAQDLFRDRVLDLSLNQEEVNVNLTHIGNFIKNEKYNFNALKEGTHVLELRTCLSGLSNLDYSDSLILDEINRLKPEVIDELMLIKAELEKADRAFKLLSRSLQYQHTLPDAYSGVLNEVDNKLRYIEILINYLNNLSAENFSQIRLETYLMQLKEAGALAAFEEIYQKISLVEKKYGTVENFGKKLKEVVDGRRPYMGKMIFRYGFYNLPDEFVRAMEAVEHLDWGGGAYYKSLKDWMHFEIITDYGREEVLDLDKEMIQNYINEHGEVIE